VPQSCALSPVGAWQLHRRVALAGERTAGRTCGPPLPGSEGLPVPGSAFALGLG